MNVPSVVTAPQTSKWNTFELCKMVDLMPRLSDLLARTGKSVTIGTLRCPRGRMWTHLTFTYPVSFLWAPDDQEQSPLYKLCFPVVFFLAMAFITYILLAGMALGIQKRWVCSSSGVFMTRGRRVCLKLKACVVHVSLKVQSWGSGTVCQHCSCVGHHRGLGDVVEFVSADCAQRPHNPWPCCLQWIQIRWVSVTLLSVCVTHVSAVVIRHEEKW